MNKVILLAVLLPVTAFGQIMENFESGNTGKWIQIPEGHWAADNSYSISGNYSLHHSFDNLSTGNDRIALSLEGINPDEGTTRWRFKLRCGFDPSSMNNWALFLMADPDLSLPDFNQIRNGFAAGVNQTGHDDTLRLWKIKQGVYMPLINSGINWQNNIGTADAAEIVIERSRSGLWSLSVFRHIGEQSGFSSTATDPELFSPGWLVLSYNYSATRDRLLWFDDLSVEGTFGPDTVSPPAPLHQRGDVIITEIMADPVPSVSLPDKEYVEIKNITALPLSMYGWSLISGDQKIPVPDITIMPDEYRIITHIKDTSLFSKYGKVIGLKSFPALLDGGLLIALASNTGTLIHGVEYSDRWYGNELKASGGWSLEMIDVNYPFHYEANWKASASKSGGTPGSPNSVSRENRDNSFEGIQNVFPVDSMTIRIRFSEPVFELKDEISGIRINGTEIADINPSDPLLREYLVVPRRLIERGKIYTLTVPEDLKDLSGNRSKVSSFDFSIPEQAAAGDVQFNELLFNPRPGNPDYIELFNNSEKVIDASRLLLISVNSTGDTSSVYPVSREQRCILPRSYYTLTTDREKVVAAYFSSSSSSIFEISSLPSMPDDKGHLILLNRELDIIDEVRYDDDMHYSLLADQEGVALEKFRTDSDSKERSNWHSASGTSGWGTPGAPNSLFTDRPAIEDKVVLSSTKISPDNDGFEDLLVIDLSLTGIGNVVTVEIFDETGAFVNKIAGNLLAGPEVSIIWDGTAKDGTLLNTGIYIILISVFDDTGKTIRWKRVCSVIRN